MIKRIAIILILFLVSVTAQATDGTWTGLVSGVWSDTAKWANGIISSGSGATTYFTNSTGVSVTNTYPALTNCNFYCTNANYTISGSNIVLDGNSGTSTFTVASSRTLTMSAALQGTNILLKTGAGDLLLNNTNTYSGGIIIKGGTLQPLKDFSLGDTNQTITLDGGQLYMTRYGSGNPSTRTGAIVVASASSIFLSFQSPSQIAMPITGSGQLTLSLPGGSPNNTTFNSTNSTFTGELILGNSSGGTYTMNNIGDATQPIRFGNGGAGTSVSFTYAGRTTLTQRWFSINIPSTGTFTFNNNGSAIVNISSNLLIQNTGNKTFILGGSNTGTNIFAGSITNANNSIISFQKSGAGLWELRGTNTYSGDTTISTGTLSIKDISSLPELKTTRISTGAKMNLNYSGNILVDELYLNSVRQPRGTYGTNNVTYTNATYFTGNGILIVTQNSTTTIKTNLVSFIYSSTNGVPIQFVSIGSNTIQNIFTTY